MCGFTDNENVQVAVFAAAAASFSGARNPHSGVVFNAGRNFDFKRFVFVDHAAAAAFFAGFLNQTPAAFAFWAGCLDDEKTALLLMNTAGTAALVTDWCFAAVFGAVTVTVFAGFG